MIYFTCISTCLGSSNNFIKIDTLSYLNYPIKNTICENLNGSFKLKKEFKYLDSILVLRVKYKSDGLLISGIALLPKFVSGKIPAIIYNRGGNRDFGHLTVGFCLLNFNHLIKNGYAVFASQYRGCAGSDGNDEFGGNDINDVVNLTQIVKSLNYIDSTKLGVFGWSRGGLMTYLLLTKTCDFKVAIVGAGETNLLEGVKERTEMDTLLSKLIPEYSSKKEIELKKRSPIFFADKLCKTTPILILHGENDQRVNPKSSLSFGIELLKNKMPFKLVMFENDDHVLSKHKDEVEKLVVRWFDTYLK